MFATTRLGTLGALGALALASSNACAAVAWSSPSGSNSSISWSNGQSDKGLFGNPTVNGSSFLFFPSGFEATASNGSAQTTSDRLAVQIDAAPGKEIKKVVITELGDWSILGGGSVKAFGTLYLTKLTGPGFGTVWSDTLDTTYQDIENSITYNPPTRPTSAGGGEWNGTFEITLPAGVTSVQLVMNNILQASSTVGGTSFIQKKEVGGPGDDPQIQVDVIIPEPASLGVLGLGGVALLRRSRRKPSTN